MAENLSQAPAPPKVSVIFIARNHAEELPRAVAAVARSRNREEIEMIAIDSGSTDETGALELEGVNMLRLPQDFGATKAMNIGIRTAKAELLLFLSPLVEVQADTIARMAARLEQEAGTTAVAPILVDSSGQPAARIEAQVSPTTLRQAIDEQCYGTPKLELRTALMVRRQFILGMNYLDERFGEYWADMDLAAKIARAQRKVAIDPELQVTLMAPEDPPASGIYRSDRLLGAGLLLRKHAGFGAGLGFRLGAILKALGGFDFGLLGGLLTGKKVGSEAAASRPI